MEKKLNSYVFKGTHIQARLLFSYLKEGSTIDKFLGDYPSVERSEVKKVLNKLVS